MQTHDTLFQLSLNFSQTPVNIFSIPTGYSAFICKLRSTSTYSSPGVLEARWCSYVSQPQGGTKLLTWKACAQIKHKHATCVERNGCCCTAGRPLTDSIRQKIWPKLSHTSRRKDKKKKIKGRSFHWSQLLTGLWLWRHSESEKGFSCLSVSTAAVWEFMRHFLSLWMFALELFNNVHNQNCHLFLKAAAAWWCVHILSVYCLTVYLVTLL